MHLGDEPARNGALVSTLHRSLSSHAGCSRSGGDHDPANFQPAAAEQVTVRMSALVRKANAATPTQPVGERVRAVDWGAVSQDLDSHGCAVIAGLLGSDQCDAVAGLYGVESLFRSRVVMSRHGFGRGEYKYFSYPLPDVVEELRTSLYPYLAPIANRWNAAMRVDVRYPTMHADFIARCHAAGQSAADAAAAAVRGRRLQLHASGSVWRAGFPAAGRHPSVRARSGLHRRGVRPHGATSAHAVTSARRTVDAGRRRSIRSSPSAGAGSARCVSREHASWRESSAVGSSLHAWGHFSRCGMTTG